MTPLGTGGAPGAVDASAFARGFRDPALYGDGLHEVCGRLRVEDPVHWDGASRMWVLTRHADVLRVARDPATFCSGRGVLLGDRDRPIMAADSILYLDPPSHSRYRAIVSRQFHARQVALLTDRVRAAVRTLLAGIPPAEPFDAVSALAVPLPLTLIAGLLGLPATEHDQLRTWSDAAIGAAVEPTEANLVQGMELALHLRATLEARAADPGDDLVSLLLTAEGPEGRLDDAQVLGFCMSLLVAGNETTRQLIAGGLLALAERPAAWARLRAERDLVPRAVEELLRWTTPFFGFCRTATRDVEVGGRSVAEGDYVLMLLASANRDEAVFGDDAGILDVARQPNAHLSFGYGEHFCLGAALARMEARVLLEELLDLYTAVEVAGTPVRLESAFVNGLVSLPLRLIP